jgi:threonine synthase
LENLNPTGSYKDRFASVFTSLMNSKSQKICVATSSGNTGAALSAYCAAGAIQCVLAIVDGAPIPKIKQMQLYGAHTIMVNGFGKDPDITSRVFQDLDSFTKTIQVPLPVSAYMYCAEGMEGVQTIAYEILEKINAAHIFVPAGGGGLTLAVAKGVIKYAATQKHKASTKVHCVQPAGNDTIASALRNGASKAVAINASTTQVSGLQVPNILDGNEVIEACNALGGNGYVIQDETVFYYQKKLAQTEGIFSEPAGAVALAGLADAVKRNEVGKEDIVVCLVTGSGFKDLVAVEKHFNLPEIKTVESKILIESLQSKYTT